MTTLTEKENKQDGVSQATTSAFPQNTIAIMVHKHFADRVKDYLFTPLHHQIPWKTQVHHIISASDAYDVAKCGDSTLDNSGEGVEIEDSTNESLHVPFKMTILDTTETSGRSHARRGYLVVLFEDAARHIHNISPMARQNIAWAMKLTHQIQFNSDTDSITSHMDQLATKIADTLPIHNIPLLNNKDEHNLRMDVYPKTFTDLLSLELQRAIHAKHESNSSPAPQVPYEGPIAMTRSASKCSHRLFVIIIAPQAKCTFVGCDNDNADLQPSSIRKSNILPDDTTYQTRVCWGWCDRAIPSDTPMMEGRFNEFANQQLSNISPNHVTGEEIDGNVVAVDTPVSRAYYKLDQVMSEILEAPQEVHIIRQLQQLKASAMDLGSAPGGWTQILANRYATANNDNNVRICSVDRGTLANRVANLPQVHYVRGLMEDPEVQVALEPYGPFGLVVSDASQLWYELLDLFSTVIVRSPSAIIGGETPKENSVADTSEEPATKRQKEESSGATNERFTLPCIVVLTTKLPYNRASSVKYNVEQVHKKLPNHLSKMAAAMYPAARFPLVQTRYTIQHLMANSPSERTMIAIFEKAPIVNKT